MGENENDTLDNVYLAYKEFVSGKNSLNICTARLHYGCASAGMSSLYQCYSIRKLNLAGSPNDKHVLSFASNAYHFIYGGDNVLERLLTNSRYDQLQNNS